jgi:hypothetical protein
MSFKHTCKKCGKVVEYENQEELKQHFYFKGGYFINVCKDCICAEHKVKYASGQYNYYKKRKNTYIKNIEIGVPEGRV